MPAALLNKNFHFPFLFSHPLHAVAQLVEALPHKPEGRGFDSRWFQWNIFLHYLINGKIFEKKIIEHKIYVLISSTIFFLSGKLLIIRRTELNMIKNVNWSSCKIPFVHVGF